MSFINISAYNLLRVKKNSTEHIISKEVKRIEHTQPDPA